MASTQPALYKRHVVGIDSRDRAEGTSSSYRVRFPALRNVVMVKLLTSEVPNTEYAVNVYNNRIDFNIGGPTYTVLLTPGTYSASQLATEIDTQMNAALGFLPGASFVVTYDGKVGLFTISRLAGLFNLLWATGPSGPMNALNISAASMLGFSEAADTGMVASATSTTHARISGEDYVWLCIKGLPALSSSSGVGDIFAKIVLNEPPKVVCYNSFQSNAYVYDTPKTSLEELVVSFRTRTGRLFDFNGIDNSFTLEIFTLGSG